MVMYMLVRFTYWKVGMSSYWAWNWKNWLKKGKFSWLVPMAAAAARTATIAHILKIKSNIPMPLPHPAGPGGAAAATTAGAFPLEEAERPATCGTSMAVEPPPLFIIGSSGKSQLGLEPSELIRSRRTRDGLNSEMAMEMARPVYSIYRS